MGDKQQSGRRVGLFATCLVDVFRPNVGFACVKLLEDQGYIVDVPEQSCCGQPNFNGGDRAGAQELARRTIDTFAGYDFVVVPSCSCAATVKVHYPELLADDPDYIAQAKDLAARTWELTAFLTEVAELQSLDTEFAGAVVMHDSCTGLRELGVREQPRALLAKVEGLTEMPLSNPDICCGFGGTFCIKYPDISNRIAEKKIADIEGVGAADALVSTDLGCLMHLSGKLHRDGSELQALHIAEVLAGTAAGQDED